MEITLTLVLPHDGISVPVVGRRPKAAMEVLGVEPQVTADIELALTEACTNVLDHSVEGDDDEVSAGIDSDQCVIEVVDRGATAFDAEALGRGDATPTADSGRGIQIMRSLVDRVEFSSRPTKGTVVHLEKALQWTEGSVIQRLTEGRPRTEHGPWSDPPPAD